MVGLRRLAALSLLLFVASGCGGRVVAVHHDPEGVGAPNGAAKLAMESKESPTDESKALPLAPESHPDCEPVETEAQPDLCRIEAPPPAALEYRLWDVFEAGGLQHGGGKKSVRSLMDLLTSLKLRERPLGSKGKARPTAKPSRPASGAKKAAAAEKLLLEKIEEALLSPDAARASLQSMLSEWGECAIGVDDALVRHVTYFLKCFALCEREGSSATLERSEKYLPPIKKAFATHRLPEDLAFAVPFVESRFSEAAQSAAGAVGMFQFLAFTAMDYGLTVSYDVSPDGVPGLDERLDWSQSSVAAARFLSEHRKMFNSILLALGAYHHGAGNVTKALAAISKEGKEKSFDSLFTCNQLQAHSREFIPLVLAAAYLHRLVKESGAARIPELGIQYVSIKKPTPVEKLSAQHKDLTTKNPDLAFADQLYCYASTGGYLLITELKTTGERYASSRLGSLVIAQGKP